jgi:hypothetical protein
MSGGSLLCSSLTVRPPGEALVPSSLPTAVEAAREAAQSDVEVRPLGLGLCGKNSMGTGHYLCGFLHRIVAQKKF